MPKPFSQTHDVHLPEVRLLQQEMTSKSTAYPNIPGATSMPLICFIENASCRKERLKQIQEEASKRKFGSVAKIVREEFVQEVTEGSRQCWVVVHLYKDK